jgi:hypothetical protein
LLLRTLVQNVSWGSKNSNLRICSETSTQFEIMHTVSLATISDCLFDVESSWLCCINSIGPMGQATLHHLLLTSFWLMAIIRLALILVSC